MNIICKENIKRKFIMKRRQLSVGSSGQDVSYHDASKMCQIKKLHIVVS